MIDFSRLLHDGISLGDILSSAQLSTSARPSKWAILLLRFNKEQKLSDSAPPLDFYQRLFTGAGAGTLNVPAFFSDVSHGQLDLSGSTVFGWMTIDASRSNYVGNIADKDVATGRFNRNGLMALAHQTALDNGVPLNDYDGVVYSFAGLIDLFGVTGGMTAVCDTGSLWPSLLGQEMGHGYGLDHSRADGSQEEYMDIWDVMSTNVGGTFSTANDDYNFVGPGLNAANMRSRGWLDEYRVWKPQFQNFETQDIVLRPLHRHDLPGYLAAELGPYLVEYRTTEKWDAGMQGGSGVLVHRFDSLFNRSYVMGPPAKEELISLFAAHPQKVGETFQVGEENDRFKPIYRCEVLEINDSARSATVRLYYRSAAEIPGPHQRPFDLGLIGSDAGGIYIQNGHVVRIPPNSPVLSLMEHVVAHIESESIRDTGLRLLARAAALTGLVREAAQAIRSLDPLRSPCPDPKPQRSTSDCEPTHSNQKKARSNRR